MKIKHLFFFRLFGVVLFIYILSRIDFAESMAALKGINPAYYLAGLLPLVSGFLIRVLRWQILVNSIGAKIPFKSLVGILARTTFLGAMTPGKLGEFLGAKYLSSKTGMASGTSFYTVFADRAIDLLVMGAISAVGMVAIYFKFAEAQKWGFFASIFFFFFIISLIFLMRRNGIQKLFKVFMKFLMPSFLKDKADAFLDEFFQGFKSLKLSLFLKVLVLGFSYYFLIGPTVAYFITLALGIFIPFWYLFLIMAMAWLIMALPVTILGLGTREAVFIYFFSLFNIPAHSAVAFSLLVMFYGILVIALPGAILFLRQK